MRIPQLTVAFPQRDRKFSISVLTQSTAENADYCGKRESALTVDKVSVASSNIGIIFLRTIFFLNGPFSASFSFIFVFSTNS